MDNLVSNRTTQTIINGSVVNLKQGQEIKIQTVPYWKCKRIIIEGKDYGFLSEKELHDFQFEISSGLTSKNFIQ